MQELMVAVTDLLDPIVMVVQPGIQLLAETPELGNTFDVAGAMTTSITVFGKVWELISGNMMLSALVGFTFMKKGFGLFSGGKRAVR